MKINVEDWKEFRIGDLFDERKGKTLSIDNKEIYAGKIPCVNGSVSNNGIFAYLSQNIEEVGFVLQKAPCITVSRVGNAGYSHVQSSDFYIADNAYSLTLKNVDYANVYVYLFLSTILNRETYRYTYGRIINSNYFNTTIKLPVDAKGNPDWDYMEQYIKSLHHKPITTKITSKAVGPIITSEWKSFFLDELFEISVSKDKNLLNSEDGNVPYIASTLENNGVTSFVDATPSQKANTLTIARNGSVGSTFYQPRAYCSSPDDIRILTPKFDMNVYIGLFLKTIIEREKFKFGYGRKLGTARIKKIEIKLPITDRGVPAWDYMEQYIKSLPYSDRI